MSHVNSHTYHTMHDACTHSTFTSALDTPQRIHHTCYDCRFPGQAVLLKAEQDARAAKQKSAEEDTEGTAKHQAGKKPGRGGRGRGGRGRGGRGKQQSTPGEQQLADEQVEPTQAEDVEPTQAEDDKKCKPKPAPKGKAKAKAKAKAKSKPTPKAKSQPSPNGKAKGKAKAKAAAPNQDAENPPLDKAELDDAAAEQEAAEVPQQATAAVPQQAAAAVPEQAAANPRKKRKASTHPAIPVPTFAHVDLCVYWTRAAVGLKLKTSSEKGKQARGLVDKAPGYRVWFLQI